MKALIIGAGRSGVGCAKLLQQKGYQVLLVTATDFKERPDLEMLGITVVLNDRDLTLVQDYEVVVKGPGIPNDHPLVQAFPKVLNEVEVASWFSKQYHYYAISGTNGKTTTITCLYAMLKRHDDTALLAGNVGYALSEAVYHDGDFDRAVALEISAFQMEGSPTFTPEIYALLNLSPDHLDRYQDAQAYYQAKLTLLERVPCFVRNADDVNIMALTQDYHGEVIDVSLQQQKDVYRHEGWIYFHDTPLFEITSLPLKGDHNLFNVAVAAVVAYKAGVSVIEIQEEVRTFSGVEHRLEFVRNYHNAHFYNDSKATNPEATEVALAAFSEAIVLLAGGFDKHVSFKRLQPYAKRCRKVYLFGESAKQMQREAFPEAILVPDMATALKEVVADLKAGDNVLLSPACASYDQFISYEERGEQFKKFVETLE